MKLCWFFNMVNTIFQGNYWRSIGRRRNFFVEYAAKHEFDPLIPDNWYSITKEQIYNMVCTS